MDFLDGLVRVVSQNGTAWYVRPASADYYRALTSTANADVLPKSVTQASEDFYWRMVSHSK